LSQTLLLLLLLMMMMMMMGLQCNRRALQGDAHLDNTENYMTNM